MAPGGAAVAVAGGPVRRGQTQALQVRRHRRAAACFGHVDKPGAQSRHLPRRRPSEARGGPPLLVPFPRHVRRHTHLPRRILRRPLCVGDGKVQTRELGTGRFRASGGREGREGRERGGTRRNVCRAVTADARPQAVRGGAHSPGPAQCGQRTGPRQQSRPPGDQQASLHHRPANWLRVLPVPCLRSGRPPPHCRPLLHDAAQLSRPQPAQLGCSTDRRCPFPSPPPPRLLSSPLLPARPCPQDQAPK